MKKITCLVLALLMLLAMFATAGMTADPASVPEETSPVEEEPAPQPDVVVSDPVQSEEPAPEPTEPTEPTGTETVPEPTEEPEVEQPAETEPAVDTPAADEPVVDEPVVDEPAVAPASEPAAAPISGPTEEEGPRTVKVDPNGGHFTGARSGQSTLTVTLDKSGNLVDSANEPGWFTPQRAGYRFVGWYKEDPGSSTPSAEDAVKMGSFVAEEVTTLYAGWVRVLVLDATPGNFTDKDATQNYTRTVDVPDGKLPSGLASPVYNISKSVEDQTVEFTGWYTEKCTLTEVPSEDGKYWTVTVKNNGTKVEPGDPVTVDTLYAGYQVKSTVPQSSMQKVTFYYDWNGVEDMWGKCLTVSRSYDAAKGGYTLTTEDLLVLYLNWNSTDVNVDVSSMDALNKYWADNTFNGYKFLGWAKSEKAEKPDVKAGDVIANGQSIYAVWTKGESENSWTYERKVEPVGPLSHMRFLNLTTTVHGTQNATASVSLYASPLHAEMANVVWTITYGTPNTIYDLAPPVTLTVTLADGQSFDGNNPGYAADRNFGPKAGFTATASGGTLTLTDVDGMDHAVTVSAQANPIKDGVADTATVIKTPEAAPATVVFSHSWVKKADGPHEDATCAAHGYDTYECASCGHTMEKIIPPLEHRWAFQVTKPASCTEEGIMQQQCSVCKITFQDYQEWLKARGKPVVNPSRKAEVLPATGHDYHKIGTEGTNGQGVAIIKEECATCQHDDTVLCGDVSGDTRISVTDVLMMCQKIQGLSGSSFDNAAGDVSGDEHVNVTDVLMTCQYIQGVRSTLG